MTWFDSIAVAPLSVQRRADGFALLTMGLGSFLRWDLRNPTGISLYKLVNKYLKCGNDYKES